MAITATDLAEIIGSATAMYLLFGLPLWIGVLITAADVLFILFFGTHNFRLLEVGRSHFRVMDPLVAWIATHFATPDTLLLDV